MPSHVHSNRSAFLGPVSRPDRAAKTVQTTGQRWKLRRNLVIYLANQHGASQRLLGDVFDLPHSRISAIVKEFREKYATSAG